MKRLKYLTWAVCSLFLFASCEKESEGLSKTLHFEMLGEETMLVTVGSAEFDDPGVKITLDGKDVSADLKTTHNIDLQTVGLYEVDYTYVNDHTGMNVLKRTVIVCDPSVEADMSGSYTTGAETHRVSGATTTPYPGFEVTIEKIAPGFFQISDFLGGYYDQRAAYGGAYACSGYVQLKGDNTFVMLSSSILPWNDTLSGLSNGVYNPEDNTVSWSADYAGMTFNVELMK